jgi:DNA repair protein RadC
VSTTVASCVRELRIVYSPSTLAGPLAEVGRPAAAAALLRTRLECEPVEVCVVLLLNTKHRLIAIHELGRGTLDSCLVHPRDVFKSAILANAAGVIVAHNHPSGDPTPSPDDIALCARLRAAGTLIGIDLLDFVIIGDGGRYHSFKETGR